MPTSRTLSVVAAVIFGAASLKALAQPAPHPGQPQGQQPGRQAIPPQHAQPAPPLQQPARSGHMAAPAKAPAHLGAPQARHPGTGPDHQWVKGTRVPAQYRGKQYVVNDYQRHGLKKPGRGQQWVLHGADYMLVAVATGVIAQLVLGH